MRVDAWLMFLERDPTIFHPLPHHENKLLKIPDVSESKMVELVD